MRKPTSSILRTLCTLSLLLGAPQAWAGSSDLELFVAGVPPNMLLLIDNSGSMDRAPDNSICFTPGCTRRQIATAAVQALVDEVNPVVGGSREINARFGMMTYRSTGAGLSVPLADNASDLVNTAVGALYGLGVGTPLAAAILDAGRYYAQQEQWGDLPVWGDSTLSGAESVQTDPMDLACRENFIIFVTDGLPSSDSIVRPGFWETVGDADGDAGFNEGHVENSGNVGDGGEWGDDITKAMFDHDFRAGMTGTQNITTHVIGFTIDDDYLSNMADNGGGIYKTSNDADELAEALANATQASFDSLSSFSAAVVPTSRSLAGSAFYNAFFEPSSEPFWEGHLEAYKLTAAGDVEDQMGDSPFDATTGLLLDSRLPFWNAAEVLRSDTVRSIFTTDGGSKVAFADGTASITTTDLGISGTEYTFFPNYPASGVNTLGELRTAIINYIHGKDAFDEDSTAGATNMREKVLGDIFHSTPRIVSQPNRLWLGEDGYNTFYNTYRTRDRVIYAGANDGMLHAFDAGSHATGDDPDTTATEPSSHQYYTQGSGGELFGYVPGLLLDQVSFVPRNSPRTYYYVDGSPVHAEAWLGDGSDTDVTKVASEWATVLVTGFREGGAGYIALDVTNPAASGYPGLLWEFTDSKLGEAWSTPVITRVKMGAASGTTDKCGPVDGDGDCREVWVAIFAGGYAPTADPNSGSWISNTSDPAFPVGKALYVVELNSGTLLARVDYSTNSAMQYALPASPAVLDLNSDGFADVVYVGDLGGQMWKWDIHAPGVDGADADSLVDNWQAGVFFAAPTDAGSGMTHYRSIFGSPSAAYNGGKLTLAFGTGERENLRYAGDSSLDDNNRFYVVKDLYPTGSLAFNLPDTSARPALTESDLSVLTAAKTDTNLDNSGFYFVTEEGEKFTSDVTIFAGYVLATAFTPNSADVCTSATGQSYLYAFRLRDGYGSYDAPSATAPESRRQWVGQGLGSAPRISMGPDPSDDKVYVKTSKSKFVPLPTPPRANAGASMIYWRQAY